MDATGDVARLLRLHAAREQEIGSYMAAGSLDYGTAVLVYESVHGYRATPARPTPPWMLVAWSKLGLFERIHCYLEYKQHEAAWLRREGRLVAARSAVCS